MVQPRLNLWIVLLSLALLLVRTAEADQGDQNNNIILNDEKTYEHAVPLTGYSIAFRGLLNEPTPDDLQSIESATNDYILQLLTSKVGGVTSADTVIDSSFVAVQDNPRDYLIPFNSIAYFTFQSAVLTQDVITHALIKNWNSEHYLFEVKNTMHSTASNDHQLNPFLSVTHVELQYQVQGPQETGPQLE